MKRTYYFFQHPLDSLVITRGKAKSIPIPGRYAFDVNALIANRSCCLGKMRVKVPIDSFEENSPGPNIDPCPFAYPFHIVHSFCKISNYTHTISGKLLSHKVKKDDIIFYGYLHYSDNTGHVMPIYLAIDTVLVVKCTTAALKTIKKKFDIDNDPLLNHHKDSNSDLWRYNLKDTEEGGFHEFTNTNKHKIIIGKSDTENPHKALSRRQTSYIPLTVRKTRELPPILTAAEADLWELLTNWCRQQNKIDICELDDALGETLYDKIINISGQNSALEGFVAIPPLEWINS